MAGSLIFDASALLAMLKAETRADQVTSQIDGAAISSVNLTEVANFYAQRGASRESVEALLSLPIRVVPVDRDLAVDAAMLRPLTIDAGLSLGDRFCLALARRERSPAWTADQLWPKVAERAGVEVVLIRRRAA